MRRILPAILVAVLLAVALSAQQPVPAIEGTLQIIVEDYTDVAVVRHFVVLDDGRRFALRFIGDPPGVLQSGLRVSVTGTPRPPGPDEQDWRSGTIESAHVGLVSAFLGSSSSFGTLQTLGILVTFTDATTPSTSPSNAYNVFQQTSFWDVVASQNQSQLANTIVGPFAIAQSRSPCDYSTTMALAKQAATLAGVDLASYARIGVLMPNNACTWWGLGSVGGTQAQFWVNGTVTRKVVAHEMGHNYGLYHSNGLNVVSNAQTEYADCCDMMGQSGEEPFQPFQMRRLGWLDYEVSPTTRTITASGTYELEPYVGPWGGTLPKGLRIPIDSTLNYYVASLRGNIYVYRGSESVPNSAVQLQGGPFRPALPVGTSWTDPAHPITILPVSATSVTVTLAGTPPPPPTCTDPIAVNFGGPLPCVYAPPPSSSTTLSDSFSQADGPLNPTNWTLVNGGLVVAGNEVVDSTLNAYHIAIAKNLLAPAQVVGMDFAFSQHQGTPRFGIVLRYQNPTSYYLAYRQSGGSSLLRISKFVNGVETVLKQGTLANPAKDQFFRLEGSVSGTVLVLKLGGVEKLRVTDATFTTGGVGFLMGSTQGHVHRGDNFVGTVTP